MANSRSKGKRGELEVIHKLQRYWPECCRNLDQFGDDKRDVAHTPGVHWQIKRTERLELWAALKQAETEAAAGDLPVLAFRRNRSKWYATVELDELIELIAFRERA